MVLRLETIDEYQGGFMLAMLLLLVVLMLFVDQSVRLIFCMTFLFALGMYLFTHQDVSLYSWVIFAGLVGILTNIFKLGRVA